MGKDILCTYKYLINRSGGHLMSDIECKLRFAASDEAGLAEFLVSIIFKREIM